MRFFSLALFLVACSSDPTPAPADGATDAAADLCVCIDVPADQPAPLDTPPADAPAAEASVDAPGPETPGPDVAADAHRADAPSESGTGDASHCGTGYAECEPTMPGVCIDLTLGLRRSDGRINHCGACNVLCQAGEVCVGRCGR